MDALTIIETAIWALLEVLGYSLKEEKVMAFCRDGSGNGPVKRKDAYRDGKVRFLTVEGKWYAVRDGRPTPVGPATILSILSIEATTHEPFMGAIISLALAQEGTILEGQNEIALQYDDEDPPPF